MCILFDTAKITYVDGVWYDAPTYNNVGSLP